MFYVTRQAIGFLAIFCLSATANAQGIISSDTAEMMAHDATQFLLISEIMEDEIATEATRKPGKPASREAISTIIETSEKSGFAAQLASRYPPEKRDEARQVFEDLLTRYYQVEQRFGIKRGDVAGAIAAFVAGSYMGYNNSDFPDAYFKPLVSQITQILGHDPRFAKATKAEKQEMYEQMATLGMFVAANQMALKQRPNPRVATNMREAGKSYLESFLKVSADRVKITANGLSVQ